MKKYKAISIVVSLADEQPRFLTVRDRRFKDWIFVTGGCRRREVFTPIRTALRELEEETRGVVSLTSGEYTDYVFSVPDGPTTELVYHVFVFFVNYSRDEQERQIRRFVDEKNKMNLKKINKEPGVKRTWDENDFMSWDTLGEYTARTKRWDLITNHVIDNPEFEACVSSTVRKKFSLNR